MLTPVTAHGGYLVKREDLHETGDSRVVGGKVRQLEVQAAGARGLVGHGGRRSNTAAALAAVGRAVGIPVRFHTATGPDTPEMATAVDLGAEVVTHRPGYLTVLRKRAADDAAARRWRHATGECTAVAAQVESLVEYAKHFTRVVLAVGSGTTLAGVVNGLDRFGLPHPVLAVQVGAPLDSDYLDARSPRWRGRVQVAVSEAKYETERHTTIDGLAFDPIYEGKIFPFLSRGDLIWNLGCRTRSSTTTAQKA